LRANIDPFSFLFFLKKRRKKRDVLGHQIPGTISPNSQDRENSIDVTIIDNDCGPKG